MIINCRPSHSPPCYKVTWIMKKYGVIISKKEKVMKTYADADGFARSMMKRNVIVLPLERV